MTSRIGRRRRQKRRKARANAMRLSWTWRTIILWDFAKFSRSAKLCDDMAANLAWEAQP